MPGSVLTRRLGDLCIVAALLAAATPMPAQDVGELRGVRPVLSVQGGVLDLEGEGMPRQGVAGIEAGLDLHRLVGIRGLYWRGVEEGVRGFDPIEAWGGEARLGAPLPAGITPYVALGGALVRFGEGHAAGQGTGWTDRIALLPGLGVTVGLGDRWQLGVGARDYVLVDSVSELRGEDLSHNWLYRAGLTYRFGGRRTAPPVAHAAAPVHRPVPERVDTVVIGGEIREVRVADRDYRSDQQVTIPIPTEGEITLRYGPGDGRRTVGVPTGDEALLRRMVREELGLAPPASPAAAPADLEGRIARLLEAEREIVRRIIREEMQREAVARADFERRLIDRVEDVVARRMAREAERFVPARPGLAPSPPAPRERRRWFPTEAIGYTGANFVHPGQFVLGTRADLGSIGRSPLRIVPELATGFGGGTTSIMLALNTQFRFPELPVPYTAGVAPHVGLGGGYLRFTSEVRDRPRHEGVINLGYGASLLVPRQRGWLAAAPDEAFIEHQGIDIYDLQRILVGARWRF
jgi:hypothetical protein